MLARGFHPVRRHGPNAALQIELRPFGAQNFPCSRGREDEELQRECLQLLRAFAGPLGTRGGLRTPWRHDALWSAARDRQPMVKVAAPARRILSGPVPLGASRIEHLPRCVLEDEKRSLASLPRSVSAQRATCSTATSSTGSGRSGAAYVSSVIRHCARCFSFRHEGESAVTNWLTISPKVGVVGFRRVVRGSISLASDVRAEAASSRALLSVTARAEPRPKIAPAAMEAVAENPFSRAAMGNHEKETATIPVASRINEGCDAASIQPVKCPGHLSPTIGPTICSGF